MTSRPASAQHLVELVGMSPNAYGAGRRVRRPGKGNLIRIQELR